jgi:ATP-binding cassette subfamily F protein 2
MVSEASKKKAAQKKAAAAAKRGAKSSVAASSSSATAAADKAADNLLALSLSDRTCTGVLASHPLSRDIHVRKDQILFLLVSIHPW